MPSVASLMSMGVAALGQCWLTMVFGGKSRRWSKK